MTLSGLGIWIWQLALCEGGDPVAIARKAKRSGVSWVTVKSGEAHRNGQVTAKLVDAFRTNGIECAAWFYSVPGAVETAAQLDHVRHLVQVCGVRHIFIDAEIEWESRFDPKSGTRVPADRRAEAAVFARALRAAAGDDAWLADAPWPIVRAHPQWPWEEFGSIVSARCDQLYFSMSEQPFDAFATRADANWASRPNDVRCPIAGCFDWTNAKTGRTWRRTPADLAAFMTRYIDRPLRSIWSWQHMSAGEWALLEALAADRTLDPRNALVGLPAEALEGARS